MSVATVLRAGMLTTVQDGGRPGYGHVGVSASGPMDPLGLRLANLLAGNRENVAALQLPLVGPALLWHRSVRLAVAGAKMSACIRLPDGSEVELPCGCPVEVPAGSVTDFGESLQGCRSYLAVRGGLGGAVVLGSRSAQPRSGFPGVCGRRLERGDELELCGEPAECSDELVVPRWFVRLWDLPVRGLETQVLRCLPGLHLAQLDSSSMDWFGNGAFELSSDCDRMGYRLTGPVLSMPTVPQLRSEAVVPGTLQLSPDGRLLLLMADCAPTGGYPRVGHVITADLPKAGQLRPGDGVRFRLVSMEQADQALAEQERTIAAVRAVLACG